MNLSRTRLYRETFDAALEFYSLRLWMIYSSEEAFAVKVPGRERPYFASVMGEGGEEYGLMLACGEEPRQELERLLTSDEEVPDAIEQVTFSGFTMTRLEEVPPERRKFYKHAQLSLRRESFVPMFLFKEPGRQPRELTPEEVESMLYVLRGTIKAHRERLLKPKSILEEDKVLTLTVSGDPVNPDVSANFLAYAVPTKPRVLSLPQLPPGLERLPRLPGRWLVNFGIMPGEIAGDDRIVRNVLVADEASSRLVNILLVMGGDVHEAVQGILKTCKGDNPEKIRGIPSGFAVANRPLFEALQAAVTSLGVKCTFEPSIPALDYIQKEMTAHVTGEGSDGLFGSLADVIPAPDDLHAWKVWDEQLLMTAKAMIDSKGNYPPRAISRYFGSRVSAMHHLHESPDLMAEQCFVEWLWLDYRSTANRPTLAEEMLKEQLYQAQRVLLEARLKSAPSVYRIEQINKGECLTMRDIISGRRVIVHDKSMSETAELDLCLPARTFPAGSFYFISPLGPPLTAYQAGDAVEYLQRRGLKLDPEGLREKAHLFGLLWNWVDGQRERLKHVKLQNTDGHDLLFHTARYAVADETALRAALKACPDVEEDGEGGFIWFREQRHGILPGDTVTLAHLNFVEGAMSAEVNSAERLKKLRAWFDTMPGVKFQGVTIKSLDELRKSRSSHEGKLARSEKPQITPEQASLMQDHFRQYYMDWLDQPLPALNGKTPRQECGTPEGRRKVRLLILSMPNPSGNDGIQVETPRDAMLQALGLDEE